MGGSVCVVKATCGQRRGEKEEEEEGHKTDQKCAVRLHTIIIATNHTRVDFERGTFLFCFILFLHA